MFQFRQFITEILFVAKYNNTLHITSHYHQNYYIFSMEQQYFNQFDTNNFYRQNNKIEMQNLQILQQNWSKQIFMQEISCFQNMIEKNNQLCQLLSQKINEIQQKFDEIKVGLKKNHMKNGKQSSEQKRKLGKQEQEFNGKPGNIQTEKLQIRLFGMKQYKYRLVFQYRFSRTLYKDKNFSFKLALVDNVGKNVKNSYFIPIALSAYNSNNIPEVIMENKRGQPIFKGNYQTQLVKGQVTFDKIQFRQVTSVYLKHWIYFVIYPKQSPFKYKSEGETNQIDIEYSEICPLILNKVIIKSKKMIL